MVQSLLRPKSSLAGGRRELCFSAAGMWGSFLWVKKLMRTVEMEEVEGTVPVKLSLIQATVN